MKLEMGLLVVGLLAAGCSDRTVQTVEKQKPVVYTVNYPLAYFAQRIAGDAAEVVFPEMDGDPAFWNPSADQIVEFQNADLILLNGADYAKWVPKASLPQNRLVNTAAGQEARLIALSGEAAHVHGPGGAHAHGDLAFTLWLDPEIAAVQAGEMYKALSSKWDISEDGLQRLVNDLEQLDGALKDAFQTLENRPLLGSHPVYQYLARRYALQMQSVHWEPDSEPDQAMWRELEDVQETHKATVMLWEDEPLPSVRAALLEKGIESVVFNPCGNRPESGDYLSVMQQNLQTVKTLQ